MLCDACNVRPEWKGEHKCHAPGHEAPMTVGGVHMRGICDCEQCKPPTKEELDAFRRTLESSKM